MRAFDLQLDVGGLDFTGLLVEYGAAANHLHAPALLAAKLDEGILKLMSVNRLGAGRSNEHAAQRGAASGTGRTLTSAYCISSCSAVSSSSLTNGCHEVVIFSSSLRPMVSPAVTRLPLSW